MVMIILQWEVCKMKEWILKKKGCIACACILSIVLLALTVMTYRTEGPGQSYDVPLCVFLALLAGGMLLVDIRPGWLAKGLSVLTTAAVPFLSMWLLQWLTCDPWRMYPTMLGVNCVFFYFFYLTVSFLLGRFALGYSLCTVFTALLGVVNYYVVEFRSSPIVPWDLLSVGTAASVADNFTYTVSWKMLFILFGFAYLLLFSIKNVLRLKKLRFRLPAAAVCLAVLLGCGTAIQYKSVKNYLGMDQTLFTPNVRYRNNGFAAAFIGNLNLINIKEPSGYSVAKVEEYLPSEEETAAALADHDLSQAPNIIIVMDEAFSDLAYLGEFGTNEDYMPFFHQMMEEYTSGKLMVSVKGGNTANTEYEFLSGDTMAFLPAGSVVYQQYIKDEVPNLTSYLRSLGYSTTAIHPYLGSGWDRDDVYPKLGFERFLDIDYFQDPVYIRNYVSDLSAFDKIIETFEDRTEGERQFIFEVTMQNHSGYSKDYPGFEASISLTDFAQTSTSIQAAEKYLTLIRESDAAFEHLIEYFETVQEPTVIVMFGDHQPSDYITNVISRITGYNGESSLEENQRSYTVPYVIWDNLGLEKDESMALTSVNYLAPYLLERVGLPLTAYQQFLLSLHEELPVVCAGAYIDQEGTYHSYSDDSPYKEQLNEYNILQYNHLTDWKHRVTDVFAQPAGGLK